MTRLVFPSDRLVYETSPYAGTAFQSATGLAAKVYSDAAGTVLADVQNFDGTANPTATFTVDTTSRLPLFLGPASGADALYLQVGSGPVTPIYAVTSGDISAAVAAEVANRQAADASTQATAEAYADARDAAHVAATDPHGDRAYSSGLVSSEATTARAAEAANATAIAGKAPIATTTIDLVDRTNNTTETVPAGFTTNCSTAGVTKTAPALAGSVGTPPLRWAVRNGSTGTITLSYPDTAGVVQSLTMLAGEVLTFRQKNTSGWAAESGNKTLASLNGAYQQLSDMRAVARNLLTRLRPADYMPFTDLSTDTYTTTFGTTATLTGRVAGPQTGEVTELGSRGTWDATNDRLPVSSNSGLGFYSDGIAVEIQLHCGALSALPFWVFVDGKPVTATPDTFGSVAGGTFYAKLTFGSARRRLIEFYCPHSGQWVAVRGATGDVIEPMPRRPVIAFVGDSFWGGNNGTPILQGAQFLAARQLGAECANISFSGTGYVNVGLFNTFGSAPRVAAITPFNPSLIVMQGSVNDDGLSGIQAAAAAAYAAFAAALPTTPIIVLGPQPNAATATISSNRQANIAAVKAAALAAPNVIGFHDECGTADTLPSAWVGPGSHTYQDGDLATYLGSVWQWSNGGTASNANTPGTDNRWKLKTWGYWGTGQIGSLSGVGSRDRLLYSDSTHPTTDGSLALSNLTIKKVREDLLAYVTSGTVSVD